MQFQDSNSSTWPDAMKNSCIPVNKPLSEASEEELALRWRNAILRLTEDFSDAAGQRDDLSPILMGALHNALERLLVRGEEDDLVLLEEWLQEGGVDVVPHHQDAPLWLGMERRVNGDRRQCRERRTGVERRGNSSVNSQPETTP